MQDRESRAGPWGKEKNNNNILNQFRVAPEIHYSTVPHASRCTCKFWSTTDHMHGYGRSSCDRSRGHSQHLQRTRNEREREGKGNGCLLLSSFSTTSTKYYLYTLLLPVLSPLKSSELTTHTVQLICMKSKLLQKVPGCSAPLNGLSGCNRGLAWATCELHAKEWQGEQQGQSD